MTAHAPRSEEARAPITTPQTAPRSLRRHVRLSDLPAAIDLATRVAHDVIDVTEGVHQSVRRTLGLSEGPQHGRTSGLAGWVYRGVRAGVRLSGAGATALAGKALTRFDDPATQPAPSAEREAVIAAVNGVWGDSLAASGNALAQTMQLRLHGGEVLPLDQPKALRAALGGAAPRLLLLAHGLCMNEQAWRRGEQDLGAVLAQALGMTPVYLRYNSGLHISTNARMLAGQLEQLAAAWPRRLRDITLIGHSMGGLVLRGAHAVAAEAGHAWAGKLSSMVFLATPHHGAPLERAGQMLNTLLSSTPWSKPFARLGQRRSAGITDLRHGNVRDADWQGRLRFAGSADWRMPLPLPEGVACYAAAATLAGSRSRLADRLTGDGLVPLRSALGEHAEDVRQLHFSKSHQWIAWRTGHLQLLSHPGLARQLLQWLGAPAAAKV